MRVKIVNALVRAENLSTPPPAPFEQVGGIPSPVWVAELPLPGGIGSMADVRTALEQLYDPIGTIDGGLLCLHLDFEGAPLYFEASFLKWLADSRIDLEVVPAL